MCNTNHAYAFLATKLSNTFSKAMEKVLHGFVFLANIH